MLKKKRKRASLSLIYPGKGFLVNVYLLWLEVSYLALFKLTFLVAKGNQSHKAPLNPNPGPDAPPLREERKEMNIIECLPYI